MKKRRTHFRRLKTGKRFPIPKELKEIFEGKRIPRKKLKDTLIFEELDKLFHGKKRASEEAKKDVFDKLKTGEMTFTEAVDKIGYEREIVILGDEKDET